MPRLAPLARLTRLCQLVVKGVVPASNSGQMFLPASLGKLVLDVEGTKMWGVYRPQQDIVQDWLYCGPIQPNLRRLELKGVKPWLDSLCYQPLDFSRLPGLRELCFMPLDSPTEGVGAWCAIPASLQRLSNLEVLEMAILQTKYPFYKPYLQLHSLLSSYEAAPQLLMSCTKLRSLGYISLHPNVPFEGHLPQLSSLHLRVEHDFPRIVNPSCFPSLQRLVVVSRDVGPGMVRCLAQLTKLTFLQLNMRAIFGVCFLSESENDGVSSRREGSWCRLVDPLGHSLHLLRRLELVSCFGAEERWNAFQDVPLVMYHMSAFTQLKQLQLACALNPRESLPAQPSPADCLAGLSVLTQLEQLEVLGYSSVTPGLLTDLVTCLPELRVLEVGLCRHPSLVQAEGQDGRVTGEGATSGLYCGIELLPVHQGFAQASQACEGLRSGLRVQVGYAAQWLP
jgi:hypothetical protein